MKRIFFGFEKILILFLFLEMAIELNSRIFAPAALGLLLLQIRYEGSGPMTPILITIIITRLCQLSIASSVLAIVALLIAYTLRLYNINVPIKGRYQVGHKYLTVENGGSPFRISLLYPTNQKGSRVEWIPNRDYNKILYEIFYVDPKTKRMPYLLFKFFVSFIHKIQMPVQGNTPYFWDSTNPHHSKLVVFSHGLGSHINSYSCFTVSLASQGYVVVTIGHEHDEVCVEYRQFGSDKSAVKQHLQRVRHRDLLTRVSQVKQTIHQIIDQQLLQESLSPSLQINDITLAGHSYGGATVFSTKAILNREWGSQCPQKLQKIKRIIGLDAWMFPMTDSLHDSLKSDDLLLINSQTFMERVPELYDLEQHLATLKHNNPSLKAYIINRMDHIGQSDMAYVLGNLLQLTGSVKLQSYTDDFITLNILIMQQFLDGHSKEEIMEAANQLTQQKGLHQIGIHVKEEFRLSRDLTFRKQSNYK